MTGRFYLSETSDDGKELDTFGTRTPSKVRAARHTNNLALDSSASGYSSVKACTAYSAGRVTFHSMVGIWYLSICYRGYAPERRKERPGLASTVKQGSSVALPHALGLPLAFARALYSVLRTNMYYYNLQEKAVCCHSPQ